MLPLFLATAVLLAPTLAPEGKSSAPQSKSDTATCSVAPVRAASVRPTKGGLEATAFVVGLEADRGAFAVGGQGALDVVPLSEKQDVRLAYFDVGAKTGQLKISVLRPKKKTFKQATIPDDLEEGVLTVDLDADDSVGVELLVHRRPEGSTQVIVAVTAPQGLEQVEVRLDGKRPNAVEPGTRFHGATTSKPKAAGARLKKGVYHLSFDNGHDTSARNRWSGSTSAPWAASGASFVGGEQCSDGAGAKARGDGRRRYRRIKKQMLSTLQTYAR